MSDSPDNEAELPLIEEATQPASEQLHVEATPNQFPEPASEPQQNFIHPDKERPLLDVHVPQSTHTWKDFLIHIATICIGLLIAIGLEQTVEAFHHAHERQVLIEDIHAECEKNLKIISTNINDHKVASDWYLDSVKRLNAAHVSNGQITVTLPTRPTVTKATLPSRAVWAVAKSSGKVALLPEELAEVFDRLDHEGDEFLRASDHATESLIRVINLGVIIGAPIKPGTTLHLTIAQRDLLVEALATARGDAERCKVWLAYWQGASHAVLDGVTKRAAMDDYMIKAREALHQDL